MKAVEIQIIQRHRIEIGLIQNGIIIVNLAAEITFQFPQMQFLQLSSPQCHLHLEEAKLTLNCFEHEDLNQHS